MNKIKVTHTAPTYEQFDEWGIEQAYPNFYIDISINNDKDEQIVWFKVKISGNYYCCGSQNFDIDEIVLDDYKIDTENINKENIIKLLKSYELKKIVFNSIRESLIEIYTDRIIEKLCDNLDI